MGIDLSKVSTEELAVELKKRKRLRITEIVVQMRDLFEELGHYNIKVVDMEENYIYFTGDLGYDDELKAIKMRFKED